MKKLIRIYRRWRYRRLYGRLFLLYAENSRFAESAAQEAAEAFYWHTGIEWADVINGRGRRISYISKLS